MSCKHLHLIKRSDIGDGFYSCEHCGEVFEVEENIKWGEHGNEQIKRKPGTTL